MLRLEYAAQALIALACHFAAVRGRRWHLLIIKRGRCETVCVCRASASHLRQDFWKRKDLFWSSAPSLLRFILMLL